SLRYIVLPNWTHDALLESTSSKPYEESISQVPEGSGNSNPTASAFIPPANQMETLTVESPIPTPLGFHDPVYPTKVYKVEKAMYGLHQAPRARY
nr:retrotransposon protein, putative, Ty1-copia subclass [Tanacetum cinerariifolium]